MCLYEIHFLDELTFALPHPVKLTVERIKNVLGEEQGGVRKLCQTDDGPTEWRQTLVFIGKLNLSYRNDIYRVCIVPS